MTIDYSHEAGNVTGIAMLDTEWLDIAEELRTVAEYYEMTARLMQDRGLPVAANSLRKQTDKVLTYADKIAEEIGE